MININNSMNNINQPFVEPVIPEPLIQVSITSEGGVKWSVINQGGIQNFIEFTQWLPDHQKEIVTTRLYTITRLKNLLSSNENSNDFIDNKLIESIRKQNSSSLELENFIKIQHFTSCYERFCQNFPQLALNRSLIEQRLAELAELVDMDCSIVDNSDLIFTNKKLKNALEEFDKKYSNLSKDQKNRCQQIIADMLLSTSLVPTRHWQKKKKYYHEALQPFSTQDIIHILNHLDPIHLDRISPLLFDDKNGLNYQQASYLQKLILLSLLNFKPEVAAQIKNEPLFRIIYSRKDLYEWMFAASSKSVEQIFLNTCVAASQQQRIFGHIGTIAGLNTIGQVLMDGFQWPAEDQLTANQKENRTAYENINQEFIAWKKEMEQLSSKEKTDPKTLRSLSEKWGRIFQKMSLLADIDETMPPVPKLIKNHWLLSAFLMIFPILIEFIQASLIRQYRGQEKQDFSDRYSGADTKYLQQFVDNPLFLEPPNQLSARYKRSDLDVLLSQAKNQKRWLQGLWSELFESGGAILENSGHCFFLKAIHDRENKFLLGDPKVSYYRIFDQNQFADFIKYEGQGLSFLKSNLE